MAWSPFVGVHDMERRGLELYCIQGQGVSCVLQNDRVRILHAKVARSRFKSSFESSLESSTNVIVTSWSRHFCWCYPLLPCILLCITLNNKRRDPSLDTGLATTMATTTTMTHLTKGNKGKGSGRPPKVHTLLYTSVFLS